MHVDDDLAAGEAFLVEWAEEHDLADAEQVVKSGDVETAAEDATMLIIGATEQGLFSRLVRGSLVLDVLDDVECSVLLAERKHERGFWQRLFG